MLKKKYKNRHQILRALLLHRNEKESPNNLDEIDFALTWSKLVEKSRLSETEIRKQIYYLKNENEVVEKETEYDNFYYYISGKGRVSFYDKKYIEQRRKEILSDVYDILKNISTSILLFFAIITFTNNWIIDSKNKSEIEILKKEVLKLKNQLNVKTSSDKHSR